MRQAWWTAALRRMERMPDLEKLIIRPAARVALPPRPTFAAARGMLYAAAQVFGGQVREIRHGDE